MNSVPFDLQYFCLCFQLLLNCNKKIYGAHMRVTFCFPCLSNNGYANKIMINAYKG